jgi:hypothetical protein
MDLCFSKSEAAQTLIAPQVNHDSAHWQVLWEEICPFPLWARHATHHSNRAFLISAACAVVNRQAPLSTSNLMDDIEQPTRKCDRRLDRSGEEENYEIN